MTEISAGLYTEFTSFVEGTVDIVVEWPLDVPCVWSENLSPNSPTPACLHRRYWHE